MTSPVLWTSEDAVAATGGEATGVWNATGVSIDTRTLEAGDLFVALSGDSRDAHAFVAAAFEKGAAAAMVTRVPGGLAEGGPLLIVKDTLAGLGRWAVRPGYAPTPRSLPLLAVSARPAPRKPCAAPLPKWAGCTHPSLLTTITGVCR